MTETVVALARGRTRTPVKAPASRTRPALRRATQRAYRRQRGAAAAAAAVGMVLTGLSLSHQAHGVALFTGAGMLEAMATAVGIDCGMIASELAGVLTVTDRVRAEVHRWARPMVAGCALASAAMNTVGFLQGAGGPVHQAGAVLMGCGVPAAIYALTRIAVAMWTDAAPAGVRTTAAG